MNLHEPAKRRADNLATDEFSADRLAVTKFAIGQSVPRSEDPMLVRGQGRYTDDVSLPGQAYAVMVRSRNAHGIIRAHRRSKPRRQMPGVLGVYTGADLQAYGPLKCIVPFKNRDGSPMKKPWRGALPKDKVRYVGDPVACVVAETLRRPRTPPRRSRSISSPCPRSTVRRGRRARRRAAALRRRARQRRARLSLRRRRRGRARRSPRRRTSPGLNLVNSRVVVNAMEPRAALGVLRRRPLHPLRRLAGRIRHARQHRRGARRRRRRMCAS